MNFRSWSLSLVPLAAVLSLGGCDYLIGPETRIERAESGLEQGDYSRAASEARKALIKEPDNARARLLLARAMLALSNPVAAADALEGAVSAGAPAAQSEPVKIAILLALGRLDEAEAALSAAVTLPEASRQVLAGRLWLARRDAGRALAAFSSALAAEPASIDGQIGRAESLAALSRTAEARQAIDAVLETHPGSGAAWMLKARLEASEGQNEDAVTAFAKASSNAAALSVSDRLQALAWRADLLIGMGRLEEAGAVQASLEAAAPGGLESLMTGARLALAEGDASGAAERMQRFIQLQPRQPAARLLLVEALLQQGNPQQALAEAGKFVGDFPDLDAARITLANTLAATGRLDAAEATLRPLVERADPAPQALSLLAQLSLRQGQAAAGIDLLERGVAVNPDNHRLKLELAASYISAGQGSRAVNMLNDIPDGSLGGQRDRLLIVAMAAGKDPAAAREQVDKAVAANPNDTDLLVLAAGYYASVREPAKSRNFVERALKLTPAAPGVLLAAARLDLQDRDYDRAESRARKVLSAMPGHLAALGTMAEISAAQGNQAEAERWLQEARRADPQATAPRLVLARAALLRGEEEHAQALLNEVENSGGNPARVQSAIGEVLAESGRLERAMQHLRRAIQLDPALPGPRLAIARLHLGQRDFQAARAQLTEALKISPGWFAAASMLARIEIASGNRARAMEIVADLRRRAPDDPDPLALEGEVLLASKDPVSATRAFDESLKRGGDVNVAIRAAFARVRARQPNPESPLLDWLKKSPGDLSARRALANLYLGLERNDAAAAEYERITSMSSGDAVSLNNLAWLYARKKDPRALETARTANELAPGQPAIADTYGWILVQGGDARKGVEVFRQIIDKAQENGTIQYHYGYALNAAGEKDEARAVLRRALGVKGDYPERSETRSLLQELGG